MKDYNNSVVIGGLWGFVSALLFIFFPETFNIYWIGGQTGLIPDILVIILLLPLYIASQIWIFLILDVPDSWDIVYIAPIFIIGSVVIGSIIGVIIEKTRNK